MTIPRVDLLIGILDGEWTDESQNWITNGLRFALLEDWPLSPYRALGLPGTAASIRRHIRDFHLAAAAGHLGGDHLALMVKARRFDGHQWPAWQRLEEPPAHATGIERLLFLAFKADPRMPGSAKQWKSICGKTST